MIKRSHYNKRSKTDLDSLFGKGQWQYVGRNVKYRKIQGTALGNPFVGNYAIRKYREWLWKKIKTKNYQVLSELQEILDKAEHGDVTLICWCEQNNPCHADVIINALNSSNVKKILRESQEIIQKARL